MNYQEQENALIEQLRKEASDVKSCFTNFSFQSITFSSGVLALMFSWMRDYPLAVFAAVPVIVLLMIVCRIGIFKYTTANRNYGYQLHLARIGVLYANRPSSGFPYDLRHIKWEEALKAWRVVQTAAFREVYKTPENSWLSRTMQLIGLFNWVDHLRPSLYGPTKKTKKIIREFRRDIGSVDKVNLVKDRYPWFIPLILTSVKKKGRIVSSYHAGTYLKNMLGILLLMQYLLLIPMGIKVYERIDIIRLQFPGRWAFVLLVLLVAILLRTVRINRRREILENEFLSIHSCAIMWHAVVCAHFLALEKTKGSYEHYTEYLAEIAADIAENIFSIHKWLANEEIRASMHTPALQ